MSKYVKVDDIMQYPIRKDHYDRENGDENFIFGIESVMEYIETLPTIDAVPVIRCKDCNLNKSIGDWVECPISEMYGRKASDNYCSVAERKEHETD